MRRTCGIAHCKIRKTPRSNSVVVIKAVLCRLADRVACMQVYSPSRTVVVYAPTEFVDKDAEKYEAGVPGLAVRGLGPYFEL